LRQGSTTEAGEADVHRAGMCSVLECWLRVHKALGSICSTANKREKEGQIKGRREEGKEREREAARHKYPPSFLCSLGLLFYDIFITSLRTK
jgi:hypothetical protein